ncbi:hypothetical protein ETH_00026090, partial [Eimeria tenella]
MAAPGNYTRQRPSQTNWLPRRACLCSTLQQPSAIGTRASACWARAVSV